MQSIALHPHLNSTCRSLYYEDPLAPSSFLFLLLQRPRMRCLTLFSLFFRVSLQATLVFFEVEGVNWRANPSVVFFSWFPRRLPLGFSQKDPLALPLNSAAFDRLW